jgi:TP901 family phage tail tape measure protein
MAKAIPIQVTQTGFQQSIQAGAKAAGQINIPVNATFNTGSFNNLAQPLGRVTGLATEFEKSIAASNARVIAFGASVGIINGIQNAFKSLVDTTIEVQKSLAQIGAVSGKSGDELNSFGDSLFELAKNTGQSFKVASEAAVEFSRQGLSLQETLSRTNDALTLARFTSLSAADAVDVLTAAVNSFGSAGLTTSEILNKLVAVDSKFAVSAADLANGLSRAGSIAQDVGVSFDELNGIITAVQEKTARGGAVIGNAFKSIFTRIRSEDTIQALQKIGISSVDAAGNLKPVVPILKELAATLNTLSGTEKIQALEAVGSKYNINILNALLQDLNSAESKFDKSKTTSSNASNEAYQRQIELNKSLDAIINRVSVSTDKLANSIGRIGISDNLKGLLSFFENLVASVNDVIDSEGIGGKIAKGLISGIGGVFFKVGIPVLTALFVVLTKNIVQYGAESLQTILGLNSKIKEREALEQAVYNTLVQNKNVMERVNSLAGDRNAQEQALLFIYNDQIRDLQRIRDLSASIAPALQANNLTVTPSGNVANKLIGNKGKAAEGYLPAQEAADVRRGVGGASPSSKVVSIPNFAFGGGKKGTMIANTSEYIVPNFANGGSAIFNQDMISSFGIPAGARKLGAAGGYVPNFVNEKGIAPAPAGLGRKFEKRVNTFLGLPESNGNITLDFAPGRLDSVAQDKKDALGIKGAWGDLKIFFSENAKESMVAKLIRYNPQTAPNKIMEATKKGQTSISLNEISPINDATLFYKALDNSPKLDNYNLDVTLGKALKAGEQDNTLLDYFNPIRTNPNKQGSVGLLKSDKGKFMSGIKILAKVKQNAIIDPESFQTGAASLGYIPNFADPLKDAVQREMAAGLDPSQIRITKDARLKNRKNPEGFAVINTRDEPDGKIPNFVDKSKPIQGSGMFGENREQKRAAQKELAFMAAQQRAIESSNILSDAKSKLTQQVILNQLAYKNGSISDKDLIDKTKSLAETYKLAADAQKRLINNNEDLIFKTKAIANIKNLPFPSLEGVPVSKTGKEEKEQPNIQKFLALQAAAAGATSAMQMFAKEGTGLAMGIEAAGGVLGTVFAGISFIGTKINPWVAGISIAVTAITNLAPVLMKYGDKLETEGDRFSKKLRELGDQAKKTGKDLTADSILEALRSNGQKKEEKAIEQSALSKVKEAASNLSVSDEQAKNILDILKFSGGLGKEGKIDSKILEDILKQSTDKSTRNISTLGEGGISNVTIEEFKFNNDKFEKLVEKLYGQSAKTVKNREAGNIDLVESSGVRKLQEREAILAAQAEQELLINKAYQLRINDLDEEAKKLRENNSILTEKKKIEEELRITQARINAEAIKERELNTLSVRNSLQKSREEGSLVSYKPLTPNSPLLKRGSEINSLSLRESILANPLSLSNPNPLSLSDPLGLSGPNAPQFGSLIPKYGQSSSAPKGAIPRGRLEDLSNNTIKEVLSGINQKQGQETAARLIPGFATASVESQKKVLDSLREAAKAFGKTDFEEANKLFKAAIEKAIPQTDKNAKEIEGLNNIIANSTQANELYAQNVELAAQRYEIDTKNKAISARIEVDNMAKNAKVDDGLTAFKKVTLEQYKTSYTEEVKKANIAKKLIDAEDALVRSENDKNENNKVDVALTRQRFDAERNEIRRKITIQDAYNSQISQLALDQKVADELRLEKSSLIDATRKLTARYNNLAAEKQNERARTSNQVDSDILSKLTKGSVYSGTSVNLKDQATASVLEQNLGSGREQMSLAERTNFLSGKGNSIKQNLKIEGAGLLDEARTFQQILGQDTPKALADGLAEAMKVGLSGADNIGEALQNVAKSFLQTIQSAMLESASKNIVGSFTAAIGGSQGGYVKKFAAGGMVTGGSGIRDDVPAMLSAGEYVMRKSAVQKYGAENIAKMNDGGIFLPGVRGGSAISGYGQLSKFANQTTTSGATDVLQGTGSTAYANLEDQSSRLSRFGLMNEDTIKGEITSAQQQGLDIIAKREAYRTQQRKAMQKQVISTIASVALAYGAGKLGSMMQSRSTGVNVSEFGKSLDPKAAPISGLGGSANKPYSSLLLGGQNKNKLAYNQSLGFGLTGKAYGGMIRGFSNGGGPTDDIPALLMGGEYVMNRASTRKYGKQYLDSMNTGRARFADGGEVGMDATVESSDSKAKVDSKTGTAVNISINVSGSSSSTESQGQTSQGGVDYKKMGERIKAVVLETINEEKRLGGALRSR